MPDPPPRPKYDMKRFREALRYMWRSMQEKYAGPDSLIRRDVRNRLRFRKTEFPELADFEIRQERRRDREVDL